MCAAGNGPSPESAGTADEGSRTTDQGRTRSFSTILLDRFRHSAVGGILAGAVASLVLLISILPSLKDHFPVPDGGVGFVTVNGYPKGFDYFVVAAIVAGVFLGGAIGGMLFRRKSTVSRDEPAPGSPLSRTSLALMAVTAVLMFLLHFHPQQFMEMFHEGEHLSPATVLDLGGKPYGDVAFLHGLFADGFLDLLAWGGEPSVWRSRFVRALLDSLTLALLIPLAFAVCRTRTGAVLGAFLALCGTAAGVMSVFPWFRLLPGFLMLLFIAWYARTSKLRWLVAATASASFGLLWSFEVGVYSVATMIPALALGIFRERNRRGVLLAGAVAASIFPVVILLIARADIGRFIHDSFVLIPSSIDAIWALPAPPLPTFSRLAELHGAGTLWTAPWLRYFTPLLVYGIALVIVLRLLARKATPRSMTLFFTIVFAVFLFRSAAGRTGWGHTRFGAILVGLVVTAILLEPLWMALIERSRARAGRAAAALGLIIAGWLSWHYFEVPLNFEYGGKMLSELDTRFEVPGLVPYPTDRGGGTMTWAGNAEDLGALIAFSHEHSEPDDPILDLSGEFALYFFLERRPAIRMANLPMLGNPRLRAEAMDQVRLHPPAYVILRSTPEVGQYDGVPNRSRAPELFEWADENYPDRRQVGRYEVGLRR